METKIDVYSLRMPPVNDSNNPVQGYLGKMVWSCLFFVGKQKFLANEVKLLIKDLYNEEYSTQKVAVQLNKYRELGYLKREKIKDSQLKSYCYWITDRGKYYLKQLFPESVLRDIPKEESN